MVAVENNTAGSEVDPAANLKCDVFEMIYFLSFGTYVLFPLLL